MFLLLSGLLNKQVGSLPLPDMNPKLAADSLSQFLNDKIVKRNF